MHSDYVNVVEALQNMRDLVDSVNLITEGKSVEYKGRIFQGKQSDNSRLNAWVKSFWSAPSKLDEEQMKAAVRDLEHDFTLVRNYLNQTEVVNVEEIRKDILEIIDARNAIDFSSFHVEDYEESAVAIGELFSFIDHLDTLVETSTDARTTGTDPIRSVISELNEYTPPGPLPLLTGEVTDEELVALIESRKEYDVEQTRTHKLRDSQLGLVARQISADDKVIKDLKNLEDQEALRQKIAARKTEDVICQMSQGKIHEKGQAACALITVTAARKILEGKQLSSEEDIYEMIDFGIRTYMDHDLKGNQTVDAAIGYVNKGQNEKLTPYIPDGIEGVEHWYLDMMREDPTQYPLTKSVNEGFLNPLTIISESEVPTVGLINCQKYTMVDGKRQESTEVKFVYSRDGKIYLFDSHGKSYKGVEQGASVLSFDSVEECDIHLQRELGGDENNVYSFTFVKLLD